MNATKHEPRLEPTTGTPFYVTCQHCGQTVKAGSTASGGSDVLADLNGTPFAAYYHNGPCATYAYLYPRKSDA